MDLLGLAAWAAALLAPPAQAQPTVTVSGAFEPVYVWRDQRCEEWDIPDTPLRAFRDARGKVVAYASDEASRPFVGDTLERLTHRCEKAYVGHEDSNPAARSYLSYVAGTWTDDGRRVFGLIHNEYHAERVKGRCRATASMACWYNVVVGAVSNDGGRRFVAGDPPALVAGPAFRQEEGQGRHRGFFNPTNIVALGGYRYFLAHTTGWNGQSQGSCLFRTRDPFDAKEWRGYGAGGFVSRAIDPYREDPSGYVPCVPVHPGAVSAIAYHAASKRFLGLWMVEKAPDAPTGAVRYAWSADLIHWSPARTLVQLPHFSRTDCADGERYGYASVLDPRSKARNFDTIGDVPYLYVVRMRVKDCHNGPERDLVRLKLRIGA